MKKPISDLTSENNKQLPMLLRKSVSNYIADDLKDFKLKRGDFKK